MAVLGSYEMSNGNGVCEVISEGQQNKEANSLIAPLMVELMESAMVVNEPLAIRAEMDGEVPTLYTSLFIGGEYREVQYPPQNPDEDLLGKTLGPAAEIMQRICGKLIELGTPQITIMGRSYATAYLDKNYQNFFRATVRV